MPPFVYMLPDDKKVIKPKCSTLLFCGITSDEDLSIPCTWQMYRLVVGWRYNVIWLDMDMVTNMVVMATIYYIYAGRENMCMCHQGDQCVQYLRKDCLWYPPTKWFSHCISLHLSIYSYKCEGVYRDISLEELL